MKSSRIEGRKAPEQSRSKNKEIAELKRENHRIKRELARLRKQVIYLLDVRGEPDGEESSDERTNLAGSKTSMPVCGECGSNQLATIDLPNGTLVVCKDCKHRRKA